MSADDERDFEEERANAQAALDERRAEWDGPERRSGTDRRRLAIHDRRDEMGIGPTARDIAAGIWDGVGITRLAGTEWEVRIGVLLATPIVNGQAQYLETTAVDWEMVDDPLPALLALARLRAKMDRRLAGGVVGR